MLPNHRSRCGVHPARRRQISGSHHPKLGLKEDFLFDGHELRGLEQHPDSKSKWAAIRIQKVWLRNTPASADRLDGCCPWTNPARLLNVRNNRHISSFKNCSVGPGGAHKREYALPKTNDIRESFQARFAFRYIRKSSTRRFLLRPSSVELSLAGRLSP